MMRTRVKAILAVLVMGAAMAAGYAGRPTHHMSDDRPKLSLEGAFPKAFGDWQIDTGVPVQLISPDLQAYLDTIYNQTLSRTFINRSTGARIMLSVAYGGDQSDGTKAHRPEVCYPAQGFEIRSDRTDILDTGDRGMQVRRLVARLGARIEPISYWIIVGDRIALSGTRQKIEQLRYAAVGVIPDGMLVRVSSIDTDSERAYGIHDAFIRQMLAGMEQEISARVAGPVRAARS